MNFGMKLLYVTHAFFRAAVHSNDCQYGSGSWIDLDAKDADWSEAFLVSDLWLD